MGDGDVDAADIGGISIWESLTWLGAISVCSGLKHMCNGTGRPDHHNSARRPPIVQALGVAGGWSNARDFLGIKKGTVICGWFQPGEVIASSSTHDLFGLDPSRLPDTEQIVDFGNSLKRIKLKISYKSVYGEKFLATFDGAHHGLDFNSVKHWA